MTETISEKQNSRRPAVSRMVAALFRPRQMFEAARTELRPSWSAPMLVLSLTALLFVLVSGYFRSRAALLGEVPNLALPAARAALRRLAEGAPGESLEARYVRPPDAALPAR